MIFSSATDFEIYIRETISVRLECLVVNLFGRNAYDLTYCLSFNESRIYHLLVLLNNILLKDFLNNFNLKGSLKKEA